MLEHGRAEAPNGVGKLSDESPGTKPERVIIQTRFGPLEFGPENWLFMPVGPLGFTDFQRFGLAGLPNPQLAQFRLLQCLDEPELSFIVTQLKIEDGRITRENLEDAALSVGIPLEAAKFLLIVTVRKQAEGISVTVNLRAPIVVDINRSIARQVVISSSRYPIQAPL